MDTIQGEGYIKVHFHAMILTSLLYFQYVNEELGGFGCHIHDAGTGESRILPTEQGGNIC